MSRQPEGDWHGPLPELPEKWAAETPLPSGHPIAWADLKPYERQQGGYWLYGTDPYGADKQFVRVRPPAETGP